MRGMLIAAGAALTLLIAVPPAGAQLPRLPGAPVPLQEASTLTTDAGRLLDDVEWRISGCDAPDPCSVGTAPATCSEETWSPDPSTTQETRTTCSVGVPEAGVVCGDGNTTGDGYEREFQGCSAGGSLTGDVVYCVSGSESLAGVGSYSYAGCTVASSVRYECSELTDERTGSTDEWSCRLVWV